MANLSKRRLWQNPPRTKSGYKGVCDHRHFPQKPWKAYMRKNGWYVCLGYFETPEEAAAAYNKAARRFFGPTAYLNPL